MSTSPLADRSSLAVEPASSALPFEPRSPLVSVSISMAIVGCLIAATNASPLTSLAWSIPLFAIAIEREIGCGRVPIALGPTVLILRVAAALGSGGIDACLPLLPGIAAFAGLALLLSVAGWARSGSLWAIAAFGALAGTHAIAEVAGLAAAFTTAYAAYAFARGADPRPLPIVTAVGAATAAFPLL